MTLALLIYSGLVALVVNFLALILLVGGRGPDDVPLLLIGAVGWLALFAQLGGWL